MVYGVDLSIAKARDIMEVSLVSKIKGRNPTQEEMGNWV